MSLFSVTVQLQSNNQVAINRNFWITALIAFINSLSFTVLIPIIYLYGKQFGLSHFQTSLLFSIYSIAQFFATPVIGKLSDRFFYLTQRRIQRSRSVSERSRSRSRSVSVRAASPRGEGEA